MKGVRNGRPATRGSGAGQPSPSWARAPTAGQDGGRHYCGGQHAVIGVWPVLAHRGARSAPASAGAGDGEPEPWTRGDERTFGTPWEPARRASDEWRGWRDGWPFEATGVSAPER